MSPFQPWKYISAPVRPLSSTGRDVSSPNWEETSTWRWADGLAMMVSDCQYCQGKGVLTTYWLLGERRGSADNLVRDSSNIINNSAGNCNSKCDSQSIWTTHFIIFNLLNVGTAIQIILKARNVLQTKSLHWPAPNAKCPSCILVLNSF